MAFLQFPSTLVFKTIDTSEIVDFGGFKFTDHQDHYHIRPLIYIHGSLTGPEQMRLRLHTGTDTTAVYKYSDWVTLNQLTTNLSWVRFDFDRPNINKNFFYRVSAEMQNYTRNGDTFYIGLAYDWPTYTYNSGIGSPNNVFDYTLAAQHFAYKARA